MNYNWLWIIIPYFIGAAAMLTLDLRVHKATVSHGNMTSWLEKISPNAVSLAIFWPLLLLAVPFLLPFAIVLGLVKVFDLILPK